MNIDGKINLEHFNQLLQSVQTINTYLCSIESTRMIQIETKTEALA